MVGGKAIAQFDCALSMFSVIAILIAATAAWMSASYLGLPPTRLVLVVLLASTAGFGGGVLGGEVWNWLARLNDSQRLFVHRFALDGALIAALPFGLLAARLLKLEPWRCADALIPSVALAIFVLRVGCIQEGCCFGRPTELPWGIIPATNSPAAISQLQRGFPAMLAPLLALHPTAAYEALAVLLIGGRCCRRIDLHDRIGSAALEGWVLFYGFRLLNDFLRSEATLVVPWTPLAHALLLAGGVVLLLRRRALPRTPIIGTDMNPAGEHMHQATVENSL